MKRFLTVLLALVFVFFFLSFGLMANAGRAIDYTNVQPATAFRRPPSRKSPVSPANMQRPIIFIMLNTGGTLPNEIRGAETWRPSLFPVRAHRTAGRGTRG